MDSTERAFASDSYRGYEITASATKRVFGIVILHTTLTGGARGIDRTFTAVSDEMDPAVACEEALAELRRVIDDLLA